MIIKKETLRHLTAPVGIATTSDPPELRRSGPGIQLQPKQITWQCHVPVQRPSFYCQIRRP